MRRILWTVLVAMIPICAVGQNMPREARNHECKVTNKYSAVDRLKNYPFGVAAEVRLVSFLYKPDSMVVEYSLPEKEGKVDLAKMTETITLDKTKIDSLTHILFNVGYRGRILTSSVVSCYSPRNAILFIDSTGQVFEFIELCFDCSKFRLSSSKIKTGEFCSQKYDIIKAFFVSQGIEKIRGMGPE